MTINKTTLPTTTANNNPFLSDTMFPHLLELTGDPADALLLANDGQMWLEFMVACQLAQQTDAAMPEPPVFSSQFARNLGSVVWQWLERCLTFAKEEARTAVAVFDKRRANVAAHAEGIGPHWLESEASRNVLAMLMRFFGARAA
jgi:hypothetical protein